MRYVAVGGRARGVPGGHSLLRRWPDHRRVDRESSQREIGVADPQVDPSVSEVAQWLNAVPEELVH